MCYQINILRTKTTNPFVVNRKRDLINAERAQELTVDCRPQKLVKYTNFKQKYKKKEENKFRIMMCIL